MSDQMITGVEAMKYGYVFAGVMLALTTSASAEPMGKWFSGWGQGVSEYGIKNDSAGSDYFYIACPDDDGAVIHITVGGKNPEPLSTVIVTIGSDEYELYINDSRKFDTSSHVASDNFTALWAALRSGEVMRVRLSTGETTAFTLKGTSKALPQSPCVTSFER